MLAFAVVVQFNPLRRCSVTAELLHSHLPLFYRPCYTTPLQTMHRDLCVSIRGHVTCGKIKTFKYILRPRLMSSSPFTYLKSKTESYAFVRSMTFYKDAPKLYSAYVIKKIRKTKIIENILIIN